MPPIDHIPSETAEEQDIGCLWVNHNPQILCLWRMQHWRSTGGKLTERLSGMEQTLPHFFPGTDRYRLNQFARNRGNETR
jgi:hypothetical protein